MSWLTKNLTDYLYEVTHNNDFTVEEMADDIKDIFTNYDSEGHNAVKWEVVHGVFTGGGDPCYICPKCHSRESEHVHGVEHRLKYNYCPSCGLHLFY